MLSPTNTILMAIAACDLLMVLCPAPWFVYAYTLNKWVTHDRRLLKILIVFLLCSHQDMDWGRTSCFLFEMFAETLPQMFHNASGYITLHITSQSQTPGDHPQGPDDGGHHRGDVRALHVAQVH